ncbi:MAG: DNA-directed RNA polymerase [Methanothrix sp.]|nr:DNA-directed RNA polymerase [Methanothrix sp.]
MYKKMKLKGVARIEPSHLGDPLEAAVDRSLRDKYEAVVDKSLGTIVAVLGSDNIGEGHILAGDGSIYYEVDFEALVFKPEMQEIVEGEVVEIVKFGAFLSIGPFDGLLHVSHWDGWSGWRLIQPKRKMKRQRRNDRASVSRVSEDS